MSRRWYLLRSLGVILSVMVSPAVAQEVWSSEQFMSESGLLQNRVHDMAKDKWGALLIGTEGGLVRFDGQRFRQIGVGSTEGLKPSRVLEIMPVEADGFIVREAGCRLYHYQDGELRSITGDAPARQYGSRFTGGIGSILASTKAMDPDSSLSGKQKWPGVVRAIPLPDRAWCLRNDSKLLVYKDTVLADSMALPFGRSSHLFAIGEHLFFFDNTGAAHRIDLADHSIRPVHMSAFPAAEFKAGLLGWRLFWNPQERTVAMVASDHLYTIGYDPGSATLKARSIPIELPQGVKVGSLIWLDGNGSLALGTDNKGLFLYRRQFMRNLVCDGLPEGVNNSYNAQAAFGAGGVVTSSRAGTRVFDASGCTPNRNAIPVFNDGAILFDRAGRYWYGRGDTLLRYDPRTQHESVVKAGLRPLCFLEEKGAILVGSGNGVHRVQNDQLTLAHALSRADLSFRPTALCRSQQGRLWMATCSGVYQLDAQGNWQVVEGLGKICARTLAVVDDALLVGTYGSGAFVVTDGKVLKLPRDERGFLSHVHAFMPDSADFLWMSTNQGLFRLSRSDLRTWAKDTTLNIHIAYYGKNAGLSNAEFNGGCSPPYIRTSDGWASFPTMDGLAWFKPEEIPDEFPKDPIRVESITVGGSTINGQVVLPSSHTELVVTLSLSYWGDRANAQIEYTVVEGNSRWSMLPPLQRELHFATLPAGNHVLRIRKVGAPLRGDHATISIPILVEAALYERPWFILSCVMGAALVFFSAVRLNASRLRRRNAQLERKVTDRTRELEEANADLRRSLEMKEMLVSIISHDIVTPLRFIARVAGGATRRVLHGPDDLLSQTLVDLANSSEKLHTNAQGLLQWIKRQDGRIELRPRNIVVHLLVEEVMERERERAAENGVRLCNHVALDDMIRADRNVLSIILQNAIANAVSHSGGATVSVFGESVSGHYRITIKDTGVGMSEAVLRHARRVQSQGALGAMGQEGEREVQGLGLLIIADLTKLMSGEFSVDSSLGQGTTLRLLLPVDGDENSA